MMIKGKYLLLFIFTGLLSVVFAFYVLKPTPIKNDSATQTTTKKAPNFSLTTLSGNKISLADYKNKVVILNFWATWCGPCIHEIPSMIELQQKYSKSGFTFIGLAVSDELDNVSKFVQSQNINYPIAMASNEVVEKYGNFRSIPTTFVIGKNGEILTSFVGSRSKEDFEKEIIASLALK